MNQKQLVFVKNDLKSGTYYRLLVKYVYTNYKLENDTYFVNDIYIFKTTTVVLSSMVAEITITCLNRKLTRFCLLVKINEKISDKVYRDI